MRTPSQQGVRKITQVRSSSNLHAWLELELRIEFHLLEPLDFLYSLYLDKDPSTGYIEGYVYNYSSSDDITELSKLSYGSYILLSLYQSNIHMYLQIK